MAVKIIKTTGQSAYAKGLIKVGTVFTTAPGNRYVVTCEPFPEGAFYKVELKNTESGETRSWLLNSDMIKVEVESNSIIKGGVNMLEKAKNEVTEFIGDNKSVLYWFAIIFVVDYYIFDGKFKDKLEHIFSNIIDKVTSIVNKADMVEDKD